MLRYQFNPLSGDFDLVETGGSGPAPDLSEYSKNTHTHNVTTTKKYMHQTRVYNALSTENVPAGISTSKLQTGSVRGVTGKTTASKATAGTAFAVINNATVTNETLVLGTTNITPYTFADVDVPVADDNPTRVATGALDANDANGATVATGKSGDKAVVTGGTQTGVYNSIDTNPLGGQEVITDVESPTGQANQSQVSQPIAPGDEPNVE